MIAGGKITGGCEYWSAAKQRTCNRMLLMAEQVLPNWRRVLCWKHSRIMQRLGARLAQIEARDIRGGADQ